MSKEIRKDLKEVMDYVINKMYKRGLPRDAEFEYEETDSKVEYIMHSRNMDYYEMSHMDATDEICGLMEYYEESLPSELTLKIDGLGGEIGDKGYFSIYAYKNK